MGDYKAMKIDDMEGAFGGSFKRARAELGVSSFGFQILDMPANWGDYPDHDHSGDGQEEVYLVLRGSGEMTIGGDTVKLDPDTMVRVSPGTKRKIAPGADGMRLLAMGGVPGGQFEAHPITELGGPESIEGV